MKHFLLLISVCCLMSCGSSRDVANGDDPRRQANKPIAELYASLQGSYSNITQAKSDPKVEEVHMHIYPIWTSKEGEYWLYEEQYKMAEPSKPFTQRIYKLEQSVDFIKRIIYSIQKEQDFVGSWKTVEQFDNLTMDQIRKKQGCTVFFKEKSPSVFHGTTLGKNCFTRFKGAQYVRVDMEVARNNMRFLEQGFDEYNKFIWGPKNGGYQFEKITIKN